jgi:hypothetical protein
MRTHKHLLSVKASLLLVLLVGLSPVMAGPFLVCDPQQCIESQSNGVEWYEIRQTDANGNPLRWIKKSAALRLGDGTAQLKYDLADFQEKKATYYFQARACNDCNNDGQSDCSQWVPLRPLRAVFPWSPQ